MPGCGLLIGSTSRYSHGGLKVVCRGSRVRTRSDGPPAITRPPRPARRHSAPSHTTADAFGGIRTVRQGGRGTPYTRLTPSGGDGYGRFRLWAASAPTHTAGWTQR